MEKYYSHNEINFYKNEQKIIIYNMLTRNASSMDAEGFSRLIKKSNENNKLFSSDDLNSLSNTQKESIIRLLVESNIIIDKSLIREKISRKIIFNPHQLINKNIKILKFINFIILYISIPVFIIGLLICILFGKLILFYNYSFFEIVLLIIPLVILSIFFHEFSHAIVAEYNGAFVPEMGLKLNMVNNFFIPIFYTTIIGRNDLQKNKRISILLAGILMNICFAGMGLLVTTFTVGLIHDILVFIFIINFLMAISNMTVLLRTDGYFILEEIFEIINLDHKTIKIF